MKKEVVLFLLVVIMIGFISADFSIGNLSHSMQTEYGPNETLKGWINISFNNERVNSKFFDSQNNSIKILDLIKKNQAFNYTCNTQGCSSDYSTSDESDRKTFYMHENVERTIGFELLGAIRGVESVDLIITSNAPPSCKNPLKVDILGDGIVEILSNTSSSQICSESKNYGCFDADDSKKEYILGRTPYCQKFTLPEAPGFRVGAWVKKIGSGSAKLTIFLYEGDQFVAKCDLPEASNTGKEIFCDLDFLVANPKTYYLCIRAAESNLYKIKANQNPEERCGFYGIPVWPETDSYQIYYQTRKFGGFPLVNIKDKLPNGRKVSSLVWNYIQEKYGSGNCLEGCIIPTVVKSGTNHSVTFRNLNVLYQTRGLESTELFYNLVAAPAKVNAGFQKLYFDDAGFNMPGEYGAFEYNLNLNGEDIFTEDMEIIKIPIIKDLNPKIVGLAKSTNFTLDVESEKNITEYVWKTEDEIKTTTTNKVSFTFNNIGLINISVTVKDSENYTATKTFDIYIYSPEEQINEKISETKSRIQRIKNDVKEYPAFYRNNILDTIDLKETEDLLKDIEDKYATTNNTAEDYLEIISSLEAIDLPGSISTTKSADRVMFIPQKENIRLEYLEYAGGGRYEPEDENKYQNAVLSWYQQNMDVRLSFEEISASDEEGVDPLLTFFELDVGGNLNSRPYLIIEELSDLKFDRDYGEVDGGGFYYVELDEEQSISFSTAQAVDFVYLPVYISPALNDLDVGTTPGDGEDGSSKWIFFILIIIFIIVVGFIVYIILQEWYKNKYETHLFKDRNNLFNLVTYINHQKRKGLNNAEIVKKLKKAKWNSEQINYALKKYEGRRTGMYELKIPLLSIFKKKPKKPEYRGRFGLPSKGLVRGRRPPL
jgi:PKD repeat protein